MEEPLLRHAVEGEQQPLPAAGGLASRCSSLCLFSAWFMFSPVPLHGMFVTDDLTVVTRAACFHLPNYMSFLARLVVRIISLVLVSNLLTALGLLLVCAWTSHVHVQHHKDMTNLDSTNPGEASVFWFRYLLGLAIFRVAARLVVHRTTKGDQRITKASKRAHIETWFDWMLFTAPMFMGCVQICSVVHAGGWQDLERLGFNSFERRATLVLSCLCIVGALSDIMVRVAWLHVAGQVYRDFCCNAAKSEARATIDGLAEAKMEHPLTHELCPICLTCHAEDAQGLGSCSMPCGHAFHRGCVSAWVNSLNFSESESLALACPVCRANLKRAVHIV